MILCSSYKLLTLEAPYKVSVNVSSSKRTKEASFCVLEIHDLWDLFFSLSVVRLKNEIYMKNVEQHYEVVLTYKNRNIVFCIGFSDGGGKKLNLRFKNVMKVWG